MKTYEALGQEIGRLVAQKQAAYGDAFGKSGQIVRVLYPEGIPLAKLDDALTVVRVVDKLFRIATDRDALGESPWRDIAGYALLSVARLEQGKADPSVVRLEPTAICIICSKPAQGLWTSTNGVFSPSCGSTVCDDALASLHGDRR